MDAKAQELSDRLAKTTSPKALLEIANYAILELGLSLARLVSLEIGSATDDQCLKIHRVLTGPIAAEFSALIDITREETRKKGE